MTNKTTEFSPLQNQKIDFSSDELNSILDDWKDWYSQYLDDCFHFVPDDQWDDWGLFLKHISTKNPDCDDKHNALIEMEHRGIRIRPSQFEFYYSNPGSKE